MNSGPIISHDPAPYKTRCINGRWYRLGTGGSVVETLPPEGMNRDMAWEISSAHHFGTTSRRLGSVKATVADGRIYAPSGYSIVRMLPDGNFEDVASGSLVETGETYCLSQRLPSAGMKE